MNVETLVLGACQTNCYLVSLPGREDLLVIDPGDEPEKLLAAIGTRKPAAVLLTHGHFDHTGALSAFAGTPIYLHPADAPMLSDAVLSACETFGAPFTPRPAATDFVEEGTRLSLAGMEIEVMHLPGHTPGGVGYRIENALFTGDTIFHRGYGRTDMPGGDFSALRASLRRILHMHEDLILYPGHGPATTISQERGF